MQRLIITLLFLFSCGLAAADEKEDMLNAAAKTFDRLQVIYQEGGISGLQEAVEQCYQDKSGFVCLVVDGMSFWVDRAVTSQLKMPATPFFERPKVVDRYVKSGEAKTKKEGEDMLDGIVNMTSLAYERTETYKQAPRDDTP